METKYTNFDGDWNEACSYCGKPQKDHQVELGTSEGIRYIHRQPCAEEQHQIRKDAVKRGMVLRGIVLIVDIAEYVWSRIPFKKEIGLIWKGIKYIMVSIRAIFYLNPKKPK